MHSPWLRSNFPRNKDFLQIKEGRPMFLEKPILQKVWFIQSPLLYFTYKRFMDPNFSSFIIFQWVLNDSGVLFSESWNFYMVKEWGRSFWVEPILQQVWIIWSPLLYFNFKSFMETISSHLLDFNAFCIIQEYFSRSLEISTNYRVGT